MSPDDIISAPSLPLIHGLSRDELIAFFESIGEPLYRAEQLWRWLYVQQVSNWSDMKNISVDLRNILAEHFALISAVVHQVDGGKDGTKKILATLPDGEQIEEVLIPASSRRTVCVSSQAGCRFHCAFCASGQAGFLRNLTAGEIVGQVLLAGHEFGEKPTNVVFMGIGEPFDNYDAVLSAIRIINDNKGLNIGARRITISTCGVVPGIERLAEEGMQVELSVSLHAPTNDIRSSLMPVNKEYNLNLLIKTCDAYSNNTNRIVTFEYVLVKDVNDSPRQAEQLARLLAPLKCRVNLMPLSPVVEYQETQSSTEVSENFIKTLGRFGVNATLRNSRGSMANAACGQLRYGVAPEAPMTDDGGVEGNSGVLA
ncbi:MAG: 23S rRNA (adenine(2503)-C(2))-methyltransferase RlmN [Kiritimatiellae bacterium]|nr:23S rRNA (adenine(2503)-C(2))-methyltransferase RlmN [Kiritimatiellia bacterium]